MRTYCYLTVIMIIHGIIFVDLSEMGIISALENSFFLQVQ